ncbi:MAG: ATP-binding protein [Desulfamplus sp.]|nr:ATP-binding protein [Desulfamplus sp.]
MIVTVASGKGGTGKTTVAVNLAVIAPEGSVEVFDCDVEEPNAHLFIKPENIVTKEISTMIPDVDMNLCTLCGECEKICRFSAITMIAKKIMVFPEMCHSCKGCSMVCPAGAIKEGSRVLGSLLTGQSSRGFNLTWGELRVGEAMSPPLIKQVKNKIDKGIGKLFIVDAPPGTSCPAVVTLRDADFALLVAEETPFGLNDLALTVEGLKKLGVPMGIVLNRADMENGIIDDYAVRENIEILQRIPFSREAAKVCAKGHFLVDELPEIKALFQDIYLKIINNLNSIQKSDKGGQ